MLLTAYLMVAVLVFCFVIGMEMFHVLIGAAFDLVVIPAAVLIGLFWPVALAWLVMEFCFDWISCRFLFPR